MGKHWAALGSAGFFLLAPGSVAGLAPWLLTRWQVREEWPGWAMLLGAAVIVAGLMPLVRAFVEFARAGGTPMPAAPTQQLVVTGFNRHVRNPMYLGVVTIILGQALLFGQPVLLLYAAATWAVTAAFVRWYEEPTLSRRFGEQYRVYRRAVPAWLPRLRPWESTNAGRRTTL